MHRTRIKVCGLRHGAQAVEAVAAGADAIGLVFYPPSPRAVALERAVEIAAQLPPFAQLVALFMDPEAAAVRRVLAALPIGLLQFHGRESADFCRQFDRPYLRAVPADAHAAAAEFERRYTGASGFLYDSNVAGEAGGLGQRFDWGALRPGGSAPMVLAGGLAADNVVEGVRTLRPWAVDVSSGVESAPGEKDARRLREFVAAVRAADAALA